MDDNQLANSPKVFNSFRKNKDTNIMYMRKYFVSTVYLTLQSHLGQPSLMTRVILKGRQSTRQIVYEEKRGKVFVLLRISLWRHLKYMLDLNLQTGVELIRSSLFALGEGFVQTPVCGHREQERR